MQYADAVGMEQGEVWKGYHCAYQIHDHIVFPAKYRKALLSEDITRAIKDIALGIQERYGIEMEQIGCDGDHIHLLCGAHPKYAPGQLLWVFKSVKARQLFKQFPWLREELWGGEFWTDGYYVATVGERGDWGVVEQYIKAQGDKAAVEQLRLL
jgi:putative transposase